jgi:hypothetical protein
MGGRSIGVLRLSMKVINFFKKSSSSLVFFWLRIDRRSFFRPFLPKPFYEKRQ